MEVNRHRGSWTQAHGTQGNPAHGQSQTQALLNPMRSERSNYLIRLSPDVLLKIMVQYLTLSDTVFFMLSCRHVRNLVNSHYPLHPWKALYQAQLHTYQYLHDPFLHLIQGLAKNRVSQAHAYKKLYGYLAQKCVPWGVRFGWVIRDEPCKQVEILSNGNIAVMGDSRMVTIVNEQGAVVLTHYNPQAGYASKIDCFDCMVPLEGGGLVTTDCMGPGTSQSIMRIWSNAGRQCIKMITNSIRCIVGLPGGNFVAIANHQIFIHSPIGKVIAASEIFVGIPIKCIVLPNGKIVTGFKDKAIIWSNKNGELIADATLNGPIACMAALLNGNIVVGHADKLTIWSPIGIPIHKCIVKIPDESHLKNIHITALMNGNFATAYGNIVYICSPDGRFLAAAKGYIYDIISSIEALPDGGFVTASQEKTRVWSPSGVQVAALVESGVNCLKVFENGDIVTGSEYGKMRVWKVNIKFPALTPTRNSNGSALSSSMLSLLRTLRTWCTS